MPNAESASLWGRYPVIDAAEQLAEQMGGNDSERGFFNDLRIQVSTGRLSLSEAEAKAHEKVEQKNVDH